SRRVRPSGVPSIGFWHALTAASLVDHSAEALEKAFRATLEYFTKASCHVSPNPHLHRTPETDSRPPADPTSRMGRAKWRILHAPHGTAGRIDAQNIQRVYRWCSSRPRTGIKLNRHRSYWINQPRRSGQMGSNGVKSKHLTLSLLACVQQPYREWIVFEGSAAPPQHTSSAADLADASGRPGGNGCPLKRNKESPPQNVVRTQ